MGLEPPEPPDGHSPHDGAAPTGRLRRRALLGLGAVAGIAAADVGGFGYAGGWLRPDTLTPGRFADRFEHVYGRHDGFRRNHAKGLSAVGTFTSTGDGSAICRAPMLRRGSVPLLGRFSLSGGLPDQPDKTDTVRGLGLMFCGPADEQWRTAMVNLPVFPDSTPQGFYERLLASKPRPDTGKADPQQMSAFLARHPETVAALQIIKRTPPSAGFADAEFHGLNAFRVTDGAGATVPVRWSAVPQDPPAAPAPGHGRDYLFDDLARALAQRPLRWRLVLTVGEPHDPTHDATLPWPAGRRTVDAGTITITAVQTERPGNARDVNVDPLVLPDGITASDDPLLAARSAVYARSFTRRAEEPKTASAVTVGGVLR